MVDDFDLTQVLDPVGAEVAWHHQTNRVSVEKWQVGAIHRPRDHGLAVHGMADVQRLDELRRARQHRLVQPTEGHLRGAGLHPRLFQYRLERYPYPARIAHGAIAQLRAEHSRHREATAVTRTLIDGHHFYRCGKGLELGKGKRQRRVDRALDRQAVAVRIDAGREIGQVVTHEKGVIGRDRPFVEDRERRLQMRRPSGHQGQRAFLRVLHQRSWACGKGHVFDGFAGRCGFVGCPGQACQRRGRQSQSESIA
ncbi:hypothetical protein D3C84_772390 [compost metagenome]